MLKKIRNIFLTITIVSCLVFSIFVFPVMLMVSQEGTYTSDNGVIYSVDLGNTELFLMEKGMNPPQEPIDEIKETPEPVQATEIPTIFPEPYDEGNGVEIDTPDVPNKYDVVANNVEVKVLYRADNFDGDSKTLTIRSEPNLMGWGVGSLLPHCDFYPPPRDFDKCSQKSINLIAIVKIKNDYWGMYGAESWIPLYVDESGLLTTDWNGGG